MALDFNPVDPEDSAEAEQAPPEAAHVTVRAKRHPRRGRTAGLVVHWSDLPASEADLGAVSAEGEGVALPLEHGKKEAVARIHRPTVRVQGRGVEPEQREQFLAKIPGRIEEVLAS